MWIAAADSRPKSVGLVQGLAATWHSLSESGELSKWFWPSWQQHKHRRGVVFYAASRAWSAKMRPLETHVAWSVCVSVCLYVGYNTTQKRLKRSICRLVCALGWANRIRWLGN